jgi:hypothetical protein
MFLMRADPLRGQVGGGWALEIESLLGHGIEPIGECHLGPKEPLRYIKNIEYVYQSYKVKVFHEHSEK